AGEPLARRRRPFDGDPAARAAASSAAAYPAWLRQPAGATAAPTRTQQPVQQLPTSSKLKGQRVQFISGGGKMLLACGDTPEDSLSWLRTFLPRPPRHACRGSSSSAAV